MIRLSLYAAVLSALVVGVSFASSATAASPAAPTIDSGPAHYTNETTASFSFSDTDAPVTFQCDLDGGGFSPCSSGLTYPGLGEGPHSFSVKAVDALLGESDPTTYTWTIQVAGSNGKFAGGKASAKLAILGHEASSSTWYSFFGSVPIRIAK